MIAKFWKMSRVLALGGLVTALTAVAMAAVAIAPAEAEEDGLEVFESYCTACHTIGGGKMVGPDLAGVTARREEGWLLRQIGDPDALLEENDPIALQLLEEADDVPMPQLDLSDEELTAVVAYLKSTEQQASVSAGLPSQYIPTIVVGIVVIILLTLIGFRVGRKKVDVR